jgi:hypothetical protein
MAKRDCSVLISQVSTIFPVSAATLPVPTVLVYSHYSCVVMSSAWIKHQLMLGFHYVRILYCRSASPWFQKNLGKTTPKIKLQVKGVTSTSLVVARNHRHLQQEAG